MVHLLRLWVNLTILRATSALIVRRFENYDTIEAGFQSFEITSMLGVDKAWRGRYFGPRFKLSLRFALGQISFRFVTAQASL